MHNYDTVINGIFVDPLKGEFDSRIGINRGLMTVGIGHDYISGNVNEFSDEFRIFPGFICSHSHLRQCTAAVPDAEGYYSGTKAAAHGGVTTVFQMPNTSPLPINSYDVYLGNEALAGMLGIVDVNIIGGLCKEMAEDKNRLSNLAKFAAALKTSTCETTGGIYLEQRYIEAIFGHIADYSIDIPVITHCENQAMNDARAAELGDNDYASRHCDARPPESEAIDVKYILDLAEEFDLNIHIAHVSTERGMNYLLDAMSRRPNKVSGEVTLHHTILNRDEMDKQGPYAKMNPPLRPESDRKYVEHELLFGNSNIGLVTDHAPHTRESKEGLSPPSGVTGLDHYGAGVGRFMKKWPCIDMKRIAEITSYNAAQRFGLRGVARIEDNFRANLVAINPDNEHRISKLYTKCGWAPYPVGENNEDWPEVHNVWLDGELINDNGTLIGV